MINKLVPGAHQISASGWNEIRAAIQNLSPGQNTIPPGARNPFLITVKNTTGGALAPLSIVKIANPTYLRTGDTFANKGVEFGTELNGSTPDSEENSVAIIQGACPANGFIKAIADGCTPAFVYIEDTGNYKFAKPKDDTTEYLQATNDVTNIRILWHASGTGKQEAYVCLDATGEGQPLRVASKMVNTDSRPEGAFQLNTTNTWLYADDIDSFGKQNDSDAPNIVNPCGYPEDRPVIVAKCVGFPGDAEEGESENNSSSSSNSESPVPDAVAIACDTREFFMINNNASGSTSNSSSGSSSSGSVSSDYSKGSLVYIKYQNGRWIPDNNNFNNRLAVCQRDMPADWTKEFRMPYYTPESNYGVLPNREPEPSSSSESTGSNSSSQSTGFTERCGCYPGEHEFTNKRLDYHYANGRYSYEPRFIFIGNAEAGSGTDGVAITIEGNTYDVNFPSPRSATSYPDIYAKDKITVEVDARGAEPVLTAVDYPMDFPVDTIILTHSGSPGRGWQDVTAEINNGDLDGNDLLVWKNKNSQIIAEWTTHVCTCSSTPSSGSDDPSGGSTGHTCPHEKVMVAETQAKWYKKIKTGALK